MSLQITSMADIFIIILVFILKSYASGTVNLTPSAGLTLPAAAGGSEVIESLRIEVSKTAVLVDDTPMLMLESGAIPKKDLKDDGTLTSLTQALKKVRDKQVLIAQNNSDVKVDAKVLIIADQDIGYGTLKPVLATAASEGFTDFKLAVIGMEDR